MKISSCRISSWRCSINIKEHVCQGFGGDSPKSALEEVQTVLVGAESSWVARQLWLEVGVAFQGSP